MYQREEGYFRGHNDFELFYQAWIQPQARGNLLVVHGLGEHSECYNRLAEGIERGKLNIYSWDLRGHGRSEGKRGVVNSFTDYCEDLRLFQKFLKKDYKCEKLYLLGHSMGGLICNRSLIEFEDLDFEGLILSSPLCGIGVDIPKVKEVGGRVLAKWLPELTLFNEIKYSQLTKDRTVIKEYEHDHLRHDKISTKLFNELVDNTQLVMEHAVQISLPALVMQAGQDTVVSVNATRELFNKISSKDKLFNFYEGYLHELFNELGRDRVFQELLSWVNDRIGGE